MDSDCTKTFSLVELPPATAAGPLINPPTVNPASPIRDQPAVAKDGAKNEANDGAQGVRFPRPDDDEGLSEGLDSGFQSIGLGVGGLFGMFNAAKAATGVVAAGVKNLAIEAKDQGLQKTINKVGDATRKAAAAGVTAASSALDHTLKIKAGAGSHADGISPVNITVTSKAAAKVQAVAWAAEQTFGLGSAVTGIKTDSGVAKQPVGFDAARLGALGRIESLPETEKENGGVFVSIESSVVEITPGSFYDVACIVLRDGPRDIECETFSQAVTVDSKYVEAARAQMPSDYDRRSTGFSMTCGEPTPSFPAAFCYVQLLYPTFFYEYTIPHARLTEASFMFVHVWFVHFATPGEAMAAEKKEIDPQNWHADACGVTRQQQLHVAVKVLLGEYKVKLRAQTASSSAIGPTQ